MSDGVIWPWTALQLQDKGATRVKPEGPRNMPTSRYSSLNHIGIPQGKHFNVNRKVLET